jgi:hypothetical protein
MIAQERASVRLVGHQSKLHVHPETFLYPGRGRLLDAHLPQTHNGIKTARSFSLVRTSLLFSIHYLFQAFAASGNSQREGVTFQADSAQKDANCQMHSQAHQRHPKTGKQTDHRIIVPGSLLVNTLAGRGKKLPS